MDQIAKGWYLSDTEPPNTGCDHTFVFRPFPVTAEISSFLLFFYDLCRPEIFTGSHCFSPVPFAPVKISSARNN